MPEAPYALALAAGLVAAVNPCGFALLPAYLSLLVAGDRDGTSGRVAAVGRALLLTAAMTLGFVAVFGGFGLLAAPAADAVARRLPWLSIVFGAVLVALGVWLVAGRGLPSVVPGFARGPAVTRRFGSMMLFGAAYAVASLGCTVGPFLGVVVAAGFRGGSPAAGVGLFVTYAAGMGLVVGTAALAVALARLSLVNWLRRATPVLVRVGGAVMLLAGGYVAWYGWYELRVFAGDTSDDSVVDAAATVQSALAGWLRSLGAVVVAVGFAGLLLTIGVVTAWVRYRSARGWHDADAAAHPPAQPPTRQGSASS